MTKRAGAAMHIDFLMWQRKLLHRRHGYDRESFIDLEKADIGQRPACLVHEFAQSADWRSRKVAWRLRMGRMGADLRQRFDAAPFRLGAWHENEGRRAIRDRARICRRHRAVLPEYGFQERDFFALGFLWLFVIKDHLVPRLSTHADKRDFSRESAIGDCLLRAVQRSDGKLILRCPGKLKALRAVFRENAHGQMIIGILQSVAKHMIEDFSV